MRSWLQTILLGFALFAGTAILGACVTINVYFPAAEAQAAAEEFVEKVIGDDAAPAPESEDPQSSRFNWRGLFISEAYAQDRVDINIRTPAIQAIQARMAERFQNQLQAHFDSGALGFGKDGLIVLRDPAKVALKDRVSVNQWVADDNRDRNAVYREIAVANGHPEWEDEIRATFAKQWVASAKAGWWYQTTAGEWKQK